RHELVAAPPLQGGAAHRREEVEHSGAHGVRRPFDAHAAQRRAVAARRIPLTHGTMIDAHLDLGCGDTPRNPYGRPRLCGVDLRGAAGPQFHDFRVANLSIEPIPWPDDSF